MSGVRNLRAMFEQKGENNTPDRGRSPGPGGVSVGSPSPSHSPRPLSKVRTTFVAIEKDGRVGLRREHSGDSVSVSSRRLSNDTDATTPQPTSEKADVFVENMAKNASAFKTNLSQEAIPESPISGPPSKFSPKKETQSPKITPNPNPDKVTDAEETKTRLLPGNPTEKSATRGNSVTPTGGANGATNGKPKTTTTTTAKPTPKAMPVSTAKTVSKAPKSPNTAKPATNTTKPSTSTTSVAQKKTQPIPSKDHDAPKKTAVPAAAKATVTAGKKPAAINLPPSGTGFVKPKPKSPTRPVQLPASLTAPTAAYASKLGNSNTSHPPRQSLSRASGNAQHLNVGPTLHRSPSRASISTVGTTANTRSLKRQSSTISRPRPSLGPPPKQTARDHPLAKKEAHVDEGFLARMMRPTQASSSKTAEKAPVTPPRKQSAPAAAHKKSVTKDTEGSAKKIAAKIQASTNKAKTTVENTKPADKEAPSAKEIAPVVAQTETAEAAIDTAKASAETAVAPVVEEVPVEPVGVEESKQEEKDDAVEKSPEPVATVPAITEDPEKAEDIKDVVQDAVEEPAEQTPAKPIIEVAADEEPEAAEEVQDEQPKDEVNDEGAPAQAEVIEVPEDPKVEEPTVGEEPKIEEPEAAETEEAKVEEPKKEEAPKVEDVQVQEDKAEIPSEAREGADA
ncbi:hypothetical protein GGS26DRAFT_592035 [Hypomontagnella submonticulosa]|nr:hypothetical protein GGS26DRAFT_592035 [Hypomontagnella submonticulosa]